MIAIQATIIGFSGKPSTLFSACDPDTGIVAISVEAEYRRERRNGCLVLTNDMTLDHRDSVFDEEKLYESIEALFLMQSGLATDGKSPRLVFSERAARANPASAIEKDGVDANGQKYRVMDGITNTQVACLATVWYAYRMAGTANKVSSMVESMNAVFSLADGYILTI